MLVIRGGMRHALVATLLVVSACSPGLRVDTYPTKPGSDADCKALFADAPQKVGGQDKILVEDDNAAAWGAPPIILRCGVEVPEGYTPTSECYPVDELCWYPQKTADGQVFTVTGRELFVSLELPDDYQPYSEPLADIAAAIDKHIPPKPAS
jgi:hypothetical protein